ncbi:MAG: hypothetical protein QOJ98_1175 [Acidobacteriota bacterium]|nr:hypothetical protein [Acidobacteriota bacterium]
MNGSVIQGSFPRGVAQLRMDARIAPVAQRQPQHPNATPLPPAMTAFPSHGGQPLPHDVRQRMESLFSAGFADVRVHVGPHVSSLGANAFTHGTHVHFAPGQYAPGTPQGIQRLAHELAHVVQQRSGRARNPFGSGVAVLHDHALEAEAERMSQRAGVANAVHPPAGPGAPPIQRYTVVGSARIFADLPAKRPWFSYPYAVLGSARLAAQMPRTGIGGRHRFLTTKDGNNANVHNSDRNGLSIRVSDDGNMAIENTDLRTRQPKVFYATTGVVTASNAALQSVGSKFRLRENGRPLTILTGWYSSKTLNEVTGEYLNDLNVAVSPNRAPQNCNAMAEQLTGKPRGFLQGGAGTALTVAGRVAPTAMEQYDLAYRYYNRRMELSPERNRELINRFAREYPRERREDVSDRESANIWARPNVGEAYMIASLGSGPDLGGGRSTLRDYTSGEDRTVSWPYHYAGVVARSGNDRVTLENYARGDNRMEDADPRWYFQMYGEGSGQTFHEFHDARKEYANAITTTVR